MTENERAALEEELELAFGGFEVYEGEDEEVALKNLIIGLQFNAYERGVAWGLTKSPGTTSVADATAPLTANQAAALLSRLLSDGNAMIRLEIA